MLSLLSSLHFCFSSGWRRKVQGEASGVDRHGHHNGERDWCPGHAAIFRRNPVLWLRLRSLGSCKCSSFSLHSTDADGFRLHKVLYFSSRDLKYSQYMLKMEIKAIPTPYGIPSWTVRTIHEEFHHSLSCLVYFLAFLFSISRSVCKRIHSNSVVTFQAVTVSLT